MVRQRVVVAVALLRDGGNGREVLAGCRSGPPELAGRWELPGGKVEPGETEAAAVVRECAEELGVVVEPDRRVGGAHPAAVAGLVLHLWTGTVTAGEPAAREHRELRWLDAASLGSVAWLGSEALLLMEVARLLSAPA